MFALKNVRHFNNVSKSLPFIGSTKISKTILKTDNKICVFSVRHESIKLRSSFIYKYKLDHITPYGFSLLLIPIATFGLGFWQIKRKIWKESLIAEVQSKVHLDPINLPDNLEDLNSMDYRPVRVKGKFLHDREIFVGPRSLIKHDGKPDRPGLMTTQKQSAFGYLVVTPLKLQDREDVILVNRGWVPRDKLNSAKRPEGQITQTVELVGIVRKGEQRRPFTPKSTGSTFLYRDLPKMCALTGAQPYFIDAVFESSVPGGPIGGQTIVTIRNEHLQYVITWLSLSGFTSLFWYKLVYKARPVY